ncbi:MAG: hypothetical protein CVV16_00820 [Gammaproteobacteria bacterium HGW-Gammaproteobacteria-6]|nr:MAG: hypothetical protein CVV16_00820 [Gammaproteobacteria bacterium HGW-Gammaproteobacteria-6]
MQHRAPKSFVVGGCIWAVASSNRDNSGWALLFFGYQQKRRIEQDAPFLELIEPTKIVPVISTGVAGIDPTSLP